MSEILFPVTEIVDVRTAIRKHIVERLQFESTAQDRIRASQIIWLDGEKLREARSIVLVYTGEERIDRENPISTAPPRFWSYLAVAIEIVATSDLDDVQDTLDALALAVRSIVLRDETQGGHCNDTELVGLTPFQGTADGEVIWASLRLEFECEYEFGVEGDDLVGDRLEGIDAKWDLGPEPDGVLEAVDTIDFPEE